MKKLLLFLFLLPSLVFAQQNPAQAIDYYYRQYGLGLSPEYYTSQDKNKVSTIDSKLQVINSDAEFATASGNQYYYKGTYWERKAGNITSSSPGYGFARLPGPSGYHYARVLSQGWVQAEWATTSDSTINYNTQINKALDYAIWVNGNNPRLILPPGTTTVTQIGVYVPNVIIIGHPAGSRIKKSATRGIAFDINANNVVLQNVTIDADASLLDGGVWGSGNNILIKNVTVLKPDAIGIVISATWSNGTSFINTTSDGSRVEDCTVISQKRYHDIGAPAPFLAGSGATNWKFIRCKSIDNNADAFDSDNANGTFDNCEAIKTGTQSTYAGFWMEGGESPSRVLLINPKATNFAVGVGSSEKVALTVRGGYAKSCQRAIDTPQGGDYAPEISDFLADGCGNGLESSDINGVYRFTAGVHIVNSRSINKLSKYDLVNYAVGASDKDFIVDGGYYPDTQLEYENGGSQRVFINNVITVSKHNWQCSGVPTIEIYINGGQIYHLDGARVEKCVINGVQFKGQGSGHAVYLIGGGYYNTTIINSSFDGFAYIHENATFDPCKNTWVNITNAPAACQGFEGIFRGTANSNTKWISTILGANLPSGQYMVNGSPGTTGLPTDPSGYNFWHVRVSHGENSSGNLGNWILYEAANLTNGKRYSRSHQDTGGGVDSPWVEDVNTGNFPVSTLLPVIVTTNTVAGINAAISTAGTSGRTSIILPAAGYQVPNSTTLTIPSNIKIYMADDAYFYDQGTIVFQGELSASKRTIFDPALTVRVNPNTNPIVYPEYWGGRPVIEPRDKTLGTNVNSTVAIQKALDSFLPPNGYLGNNKNRQGSIQFDGTYFTTDQLTMTEGAINLIGRISGMYGGSGIRFVGTADSTKALIRINGASYVQIENMGFTATRSTNIAARLKAAVYFYTSVGGTTQRQADMRNFTVGDQIGTYSDADAGRSFQYGVLSGTANANNDFMNLTNFGISDCYAAICNKNNQNFHWTYKTGQFSNCNWVYESTTGGGDITWDNTFANSGITEGFMNILGDQNLYYEGELNNIGFEDTYAEYFIKSQVRTQLIVRNASFSFRRDDSILPSPKIIAVSSYHSSVEFFGGYYHGINGSNPLGHKAEVATLDNFFGITNIAFRGRFTGIENIRLVRQSSQFYQHIRLDLEAKTTTNYTADKPSRTITPGDPNWTGSGPYYYDLSKFFGSFPVIFETEVVAQTQLYGQAGRTMLHGNETIAWKGTTTTVSNKHEFQVSGLLLANEYVQGIGVLAMESLVGGTNSWDYVTVGTSAEPERWGKLYAPNSRAKNTIPINPILITADTPIIFRQWTDKEDRLITQSGTTLTADGFCFTADNVGKTFIWLTGPNAGNTMTITGVTDTSHATVDVSATQSTPSRGRIRSYFNTSKQLQIDVYKQVGNRGSDRVMIDYHSQLNSVTITTP